MLKTRARWDYKFSSHGCCCYMCSLLMLRRVCMQKASFHWTCVAPLNVGWSLLNKGGGRKKTQDLQRTSAIAVLARMLHCLQSSYDLGHVKCQMQPKGPGWDASTRTGQFWLSLILSFSYPQARSTTWVPPFVLIWQPVLGPLWTDIFTYAGAFQAHLPLIFCLFCNVGHGHRERQSSDDKT